MQHHPDENEMRERLAEAFSTLAHLTHKINNPLTSLIGRAQLLRMAGAADERTLRAAQVIEDSATRVADYVAELACVVQEAREVLAEAPHAPEAVAGVLETTGCGR